MWLLALSTGAVSLPVDHLSGVSWHSCGGTSASLQSFTPQRWPLTPCCLELLTVSRLWNSTGDLHVKTIIHWYDERSASTHLNPHLQVRVHNQKICGSSWKGACVGSDCIRCSGLLTAVTHTEHFSSININVGSRKQQNALLFMIQFLFGVRKESVPVSYFCAVAVNICLSFSY